MNKEEGNMAVGYTKKDKELLIRHLRNQQQQILKQMDDKMNKRALQTQQKILRRLNGVSVTLWNVKIKDSFNVERNHKLTTKNLIKDIQQMKSNALKQAKINTSDNNNTMTGHRNSNSNSSYHSRRI
ncbi:uncharacterized protein J8A68_005151 [[Candida] subhashii]|uniref:Uncharacterized protein n=1 Tax=[Candida] subhashii TaxID=561895 RepID=A0A8J5QG14_9ASCO|nr:uncharacterized protein J8A68_005151 [[Candida] subhashii]KAG7661359.1 hypothetical protein J8A68_005151 [[Candida] subhashii]